MFIAALALARIDADVHVYGAGTDLARSERLATRLGVADQLTCHGSASHHRVLRAMRQADAVVLSSRGYETQGLTAYEAVSLGTPVILRDPDISRELPASLRHTATGASVTAFADTLSNFVTDLAHHQHTPAPSDAFLQSALTERAEALYALAATRHRAWAQTGPLPQLPRGGVRHAA